MAALEAGDVRGVDPFADVNSALQTPNKSRHLGKESGVDSAAPKKVYQSEEDP
jgi:hypothetical protein